MLSRRAFLYASAAAPLALVSSCRQREAFSGYAFVANSEGHSIAAVDLGVFAVTKRIPVGGNPSAVLSNASGSVVYALTPDTGRVYEILTDKLAVSRTAAVAQQILGMRLSSDGKTIYVACRNPRRVAAISTASMRTEWMLPLPAEPFDFDLSPDGKWIAVSFSGFLQLIDLAGRRPGARIDTSGDAGILRFQSDSTQLIAARPTERMLNVYQTASARLVAKLPLALRPDCFCFNADGGQLFVTGEGMDGVVVVYPYYTPMIGETVLAGHAPGAMAVTPDFLFVANSQSRDVSVLDAASKRLVAVAPAGTNPSFIAITPDNQYALVLNEDSGDMSVIWIPGLTRTRARERTAGLFTIIPIGSKPVSAVVVAI